MIEINNLTAQSVKEDVLKKVAEKILKGEKQEKKDLSIALVGQGRIRELNKKYRGKNRVTDVLSFSYSAEGDISSKTRYSAEGDISDKARYDNLGEIVICLSEVKKNAKRFTPLEITRTGKKYKKKESLTRFKQTFQEELFRILIHGILHLLGYNHEKGGQEAKKMIEKEDFYLSLIAKN